MGKRRRRKAQPCILIERVSACTKLWCICLANDNGTTVLQHIDQSVIGCSDVVFVNAAALQCIESGAICIIASQVLPGLGSTDWAPCILTRVNGRPLTAVKSFTRIGSPSANKLVVMLHHK